MIIEPVGEMERSQINQTAKRFRVPHDHRAGRRDGAESNESNSEAIQRRRMIIEPVGEMERSQMNQTAKQFRGAA